MIIHKAKIDADEKEVTITSFIEYANPKRKPQTLWYKFPLEYKDSLSDTSDTFLIAMLFEAMFNNESITVKNTLSQKIVDNLDAYQKYFINCYPKKFHPISIHYDKIDSSPKINPERFISCAFSGGIDSFYLVQTLLPELKTTNSRLKCLFVHGFDIPLEDVKGYQTALNHYQTLKNTLPVDIVPIKTNFRSLIPSKKIHWEISHGVALISTAQLISPLISQFYIGSSQTAEYQGGNGSNIVTDPLLSSDVLEIIHQGADTTRVQKTMAITGWPIIYDKLRVCWDRPKGVQNCGKCEKCIRTMTTLEILGVLKKFNTFPNKFNINSWVIDPGSEPEKRLAREVRDFAIQQNRPDVAESINQTLNQKKLFRLLIKKIRGLWKMILWKIKGISYY